MADIQVEEAKVILTGYLRNQMDLSFNAKDKFLDFLITISTIAVAFAGLIASLSTLKVDLMLLILAEISFVFSVCSGIIIRWVNFTTDADNLAGTIEKIILNLNRLESDSLKDQQLGLDFANGSQTINIIRKRDLYWVIVPLFVGIALTGLAFLVPFLEINCFDTQETFRKQIIQQPVKRFPVEHFHHY